MFASQKSKLSPCLPDIRPKGSPTTESCYIADTPTAVSPPTREMTGKKPTPTCSNLVYIQIQCLKIRSDPGLRKKPICIKSEMTETTDL